MQLGEQGQKEISLTRDHPGSDPTIVRRQIPQQKGGR